MNVGIITTTKNIDYLKLPNNLYLVFYIKKDNNDSNIIKNIIDYLLLNDCKYIYIDDKKLQVSIGKNFKNIKNINTIFDIPSKSKTKKIITYNFSKKNNLLSSFEKCNYLRKDKTSSDTINTIKQILKDNNINVRLKGLRRSLKGSYSIRLELDNGKGSNGKGTSLSLAKASAYAELIERLQSNMLNKRRIFSNKIDKKHYLFDSILSTASANYKKDFFKLDDIYFNLDKAVNIKDGTTELLPINAICSFCHTNGLASGNTYEEAINQAIFEIFERYCYQKLLTGEYNIKNIDILTYPITKNNKKMLDALNKVGFTYYIKDCSLGKYPVIGFLLFDKEHKNYTFTMGSDTSFNIALSRCITEMMQGVNFKELKQKMIPYETQEELVKLYGKSFKSYNWLRCFNNNNGYLINKFFSNEYININNLCFKDYLTTNIEILDYLKIIIDKKIFIIDYNTLGFNTYRVYIPSMTEVDCFDYEDLNINMNYEKLKHIYTNILNASKEDILFFIDTFLNVCMLIKYDELIKPSDLFHVYESSEYYKLDFTNLLIILCLIYFKNKEIADLLKYKIESFPLNSKKEFIYKIFYNCILNKDYYDVKDKSISDYIKYIMDNPMQYLINLNPLFNQKESLLHNKKA
ncbi:MAG: YcaO-like family protein [Bacilli bacterium]|nr:YcaO-like family protein [Bacilli bacterium]